MISILAQERLLGAALGSAFAGLIVFEQRKCIYKSIADNQSQYQTREPIFRKEYHPEIAHLWNRAVDETFLPVIEYFSSRG